jgi:hypothetical protein
MDFKHRSGRGPMNDLPYWMCRKLERERIVSSLNQAERLAKITEKDYVVLFDGRVIEAEKNKEAYAEFVTIRM